MDVSYTLRVLGRVCQLYGIWVTSNKGLGWGLASTQIELPARLPLRENPMLTSKDLVALLALLLGTLIIAIVQRRSNKMNRSNPLTVNPKSRTESDVNKDRLPGGE